MKALLELYPPVVNAVSVELGVEGLLGDCLGAETLQLEHLVAGDGLHGGGVELLVDTEADAAVLVDLRGEFRKLQWYR